MRAPLGPEATAEAFGAGVVALDKAVDVVRVRGPEARSYLQGQCTQDLDGLSPGETADALVLSVQGKVVALVRCWVLAEDDVALETAAGFGAALHERLRRFKIRVKADLETASWPLLEVRGPGAAAVGAAAAADLAKAHGEPPGGRASPTAVPWPAVDLLGSAVAAGAEVDRGDAETFEAARIEAGIPAMGSELDESTIPFEAGVVPWTVSFTKGCYTGQELVARLEARGARVPRVLRGLVLEGPAAPRPAPGAALVADGREVGTVTSVAWSPWRGATVGLCYARRGVEPPVRLAVRLGGDDGATAPAAVEALPLRGPRADGAEP